MTAGRLWHVALAAEWEAAAGGAGYRTSTFGRTLDEEGFTHCAHAAQVEGVIRRFYAAADEPLLLLEIDPSRLTCPVVEEVPEGAAEAYPHLYGPIDAGAVAAVHHLARREDGGVVLPAVLTGRGATGPSS